MLMGQTGDCEIDFENYTVIVDTGISPVPQKPTQNLLTSFKKPKSVARVEVPKKEIVVKSASNNFEQRRAYSIEDHDLDLVWGDDACAKVESKTKIKSFQEDASQVSLQHNKSTNCNENDGQSLPIDSFSMWGLSALTDNAHKAVEPWLSDEACQQTERELTHAEHYNPHSAFSHVKQSKTGMTLSREWPSVHDHATLSEVDHTLLACPDLHINRSVTVPTSASKQQLYRDRVISEGSYDRHCEYGHPDKIYSLTYARQSSAHHYNDYEMHQREYEEQKQHEVQKYFHKPGRTEVMPANMNADDNLDTGSAHWGDLGDGRLTAHRDPNATRHRAAIISHSFVAEPRPTGSNADTISHADNVRGRYDVPSPMPSVQSSLNRECGWTEFSAEAGLECVDGNIDGCSHSTAVGGRSTYVHAAEGDGSEDTWVQLEGSVDGDDSAGREQLLEQRMKEIQEGGEYKSSLRGIQSLIASSHNKQSFGPIPESVCRTTVADQHYPRIHVDYAPIGTADEVYAVPSPARKAQNSGGSSDGGGSNSSGKYEACVVDAQSWDDSMWGFS